MTEYKFLSFLGNIIEIISVRVCGTREAVSTTTVLRYIFNKMQRYTVLLYLETALRVSGGISTHHHERIQLYLQYLVFVTPLLLSAAICSAVPTLPR
jgi:hypothetical protein